MKTIRYDLRDAYDLGYKEHPQKVMQSFGIKISKYEGISIADCIMMEVDKVPEPLPKFIELSNYKFD
jgi:hypothetical protein